MKLRTYYIIFLMTAGIIFCAVFSLQTRITTIDKYKKSKNVSIVMSYVKFIKIYSLPPFNLACKSLKILCNSLVIAAPLLNGENGLAFFNMDNNSFVCSLMFEMKI